MFGGIRIRTPRVASGCTLRSFRASPTRAHGRIIGPGPVIGGWVKSAERLRVALTGKAGGRYDLRGKPFAVCVGVHDPFCSLDQIEDALYGSERYDVATMVPSRAGNAFFGRGSESSEGKNTRVSCVFVLSSWYPWQPEKAMIIRLDNPFATEPFPDSLLPVDARVVRIDHGNDGFSCEWMPSRPTYAW